MRNWKKTQKTNEVRAIAALIALPFTLTAMIIYAAMLGVLCCFVATAQQLQKSIEEYQAFILGLFGYEKENPF